MFICIFHFGLENTTFITLIYKIHVFGYLHSKNLLPDRCQEKSYLTAWFWSASSYRKTLVNSVTRTDLFNMLFCIYHRFWPSKSSLLLAYMMAMWFDWITYRPRWADESFIRLFIRGTLLVILYSGKEVTHRLASILIYQIARNFVLRAVRSVQRDICLCSKFSASNSIEMFHRWVSMEMCHTVC